MKRRDMVKLGRDVIATYCYNHNIEDLEEKDYFNLANNILGHFEAEGMLPPDKRPASSQLTTKDWKIERDKWVQKTFAWEPEE